ncbi:MAG: long-chain fatty acid--CoA ligase [Cytophagales bacterium]|nr:long-chain fatty acid--CoA ligase [Cytophagales bacterium]
MEVKRLFDIPAYQLEKYPQEDALAAKVDGKWVKYSTEDFIEHAAQISLGLLALGIKKDDKVAIVSNNRPEWNFVDIGILQTGAINVPLYPNISEDEYKFCLNDAEVQIVFVSDEDLYKKVNSIKKDVPSLREIYTFNRVQGANHWTEVLELAIDGERSKIDEISATIKPDGLATIIYTSGTTGTPKGVMLSHSNIISNLLATIDMLPIDHTHKALSFLPLNHSFERMASYVYMYAGVSIYYAESKDTIADNLKEIHPHFFTTVPMLLEKVYDKINQKGLELTGIKRKLFFWAVNLGLEYELQGKSWWYRFKLKLANKLIFSKWREALGGNIVCIISGGAALQARLARVFTAGNIHILEGYGLTETSPVISTNCLEFESRKFGTVGAVIQDVEVKIAEDGEILSKGPNVMMGYYKRDDLTKEVIDQDGWFHTGDIGIFVDEKFLKITDRKKELFKTSGGKYVAPQPIENKFKESVFIDQMMVLGENRKFVTALITPSFANLEDWCSKNNIAYSSKEELVKDPKVVGKYEEITGQMNQNFGHTEQIKKFELLPSEWTVETKELTPTMKLKRRNIMEKYKDLVEKIYDV